VRVRTAIAAVATVALAACGNSSNPAGAHRTGSAAPVELVQAPVFSDARAGSSGRTAPGAPTDEAEPNDGVDTATPLVLGGTVRGRIGTDGDVDEYRIDVPSAGALAVMVSAVDGMDLTLEIIDDSGDSVARSDRGAARSVEGVPNLGVTPGRYTAIVRAKKPPPPKPKPAKPTKPPKKGAPPPPPEPAPVPDTQPPAGPAPVYEITASLAQPATGAEREPDDDRGAANDLVAGEPGTGYIGWTGDIDAWKLSLEALSGKDVVDLEIGAIDGVALTLELTDAAGGALLTRHAARGAPLLVKSVLPAVAAGAPPFFYLIVRGDRSNPDTPYAIKVTARVLEPDTETEPDDTLDHPFVFPADRTTVHASLTPGDTDCFALPINPAARDVDLTLEPRGDVDLVAELVVDGKVVAKSDQAAGAAERLHGKIPASAVAIVRVTGKATSGDYDVKLHDADEPSAP